MASDFGIGDGGGGGDGGESKNQSFNAANQELQNDHRSVSMARMAPAHDTPEFEIIHDDKEGSDEKYESVRSVLHGGAPKGVCLLIRSSNKIIHWLQIFPMNYRR